jgi:LmbE family N-acetylglucosaminyl deacetylase
MVVVSPHLDDAVLGCGDFIAESPGTRVVTIFSGRPPRYDVPTDWDRAAGFGPGQDVIGTRRQEDWNALRLLDAWPIWLEFLDRQYAEPPDTGRVVSELGAALRRLRPGRVVVPLGLWHDDHRFTHAVCRRLIPRWRRVEWLAYGDAIYRRFRDSGLAARLAEIRASGLRPVALGASRPASPRKRESLACYASQLRALGAPGRPGFADALEPEWLWRLIP